MNVPNERANIPIPNEEQLRDMNAYFATRVVVVLILLISYSSYLFNSEVKFNQFLITTVLFFIPFILDYYPRLNSDENEKFIRRLGIIIPAMAILVPLCLGVYYSSPEWWTNEPVVWLKYFGSLGGVSIVFLTAMDYNNYQRKSNLTELYRHHLKKYTEENKVESVRERVKRVDHDRREGMKTLVLTSDRKGKSKDRERKRKRKRPRGK